jgi:hypothetical protein
MRDHLFAPSMRREAWQEQLEQIHHRDVPETWRLKSEGQFLLASMWGILSMARGIRSVSTGPLLDCVQRAIAAFEKAAPDAHLLRHLHEHSDEYIRGAGKHRDRLPDPNSPGIVVMAEEGLVYFIGGLVFYLSPIAAAADELARALAACVSAWEATQEAPAASPPHPASDPG